MPDDEPDNLVLQLLRDLRAKQDEHGERLELLQAGQAAILDEMAATRSVLVDIIVQLTTRVTRLEKV